MVIGRHGNRQAKGMKQKSENLKVELELQPGLRKGKLGII